MFDNNCVLSSLVSGSIAGMVAKTLVAPIDRIKIIFQVNDVPFSYGKAFETTKKIYNENGFARGLMRGNTAAMMRVIPYAGIQFAVHEELKFLFDLRTYEQNLEKPFLSFTSGALAGLVSLAVTYPLDLIRARMAVNNSYLNIRDVIKKSLTDKNFSLYRGFSATSLGVVPATGLSFFIYELFKTRFLKQIKNQKNKKFVFFIQNLCLGTLVSVLTTTAIYPLDMVRRRFQTNINQKGSIKNTLVSMHTNLGIRGLYNGLTLSVLKGPIVISSGMITFDLIYSMLNNKSKKQ